MEGSGTDPMPGQSFRVVVTMEGISVFPIQLTRSENCAVKVSTSDEHFLDDRQTGRVIEGVELPPPPPDRGHRRCRFGAVAVCARPVWSMD